MLFLLLLALASAQTNVKQCDDLAFAIEEETSSKVKMQLSAVVSEIDKLLEMTADFISPLDLINPFPFETELRGADSDAWEASGTSAQDILVPKNLNYAEQPEMTKLRKILFENIKRQSSDRPLIWYALGMEPDTANGFTMGGYVGLSQFSNKRVTPGKYFFDSTVQMPSTEFGASKYNADGSEATPNADGSLSGIDALHWMRFEMNALGQVDYTQAAARWDPFPTTVRPWYKDGKASAVPMFIEPYVMISTSSTGTQNTPQLGIGVVNRVKDNSGKVVGVLDAEFLVDTFSTLLADQREAKDNGMLYIFDSISKKIMATSSTSNLVDVANKDLYKADDPNHPDQMVVDSYATVDNASVYPVKQKVNSGGKNYYVYADEYKSDSDLNVAGLDWIIVVVWPQFQCGSPELTAATTSLATCNQARSVCDTSLQASQADVTSKTDQVATCNEKLDKCNDKECSKTPVIIVGIALILLALVFCIYVQRSRKMAVLDSGSEMTSNSKI